MRLKAPRDRQLLTRERRAAAATVAVLSAAAIALTLSHQPAPRTGGRQPAVSRPSAASPPASIAPAAERIAERFLAGYLPYLYGRGSASAVKDATAALTRSLERRARGVPPGMRSLTPRVLRLRTAAGASGVRVTALVKDGEVVAYPITLLLLSPGGHLLVGGLGQG